LLLFFPPPRGQGTKQELPSDLALPIFSLMQKASKKNDILRKINIIDIIF
jgi:hypothetical protein